jgi:hypothetical protein
MLNLQWNTRTYEGNVTRYATGNATLVSISDTIKEENGRRWRNAIMQCSNGKQYAVIMWEAHFEKVSPVIGDSLQFDISTRDGKSFFTVIFKNAPVIDSSVAVNDFGFVAEDILVESRD